MEDSPDSDEEEQDLGKKAKLGKRGRSTDAKEKKKGSGVSLEYEYETEVASKPEKQAISQKNNKRRTISKSTAGDSVDFWKPQ